MKLGINYYSTVSIAALLVATSTVQAQDIAGSATNNAPVTITGSSAVTGVAQIGVGGSASISGAGASAAVSGLGAGANFTSIGISDGAGGVTASVGNIALDATNNADVEVQSGADITFDDNTPYSNPQPQNLLNGASANISSLGASASVGFTGIGAGNYSVQPLAADVGKTIELDATNTAGVTTDGTSVSSVTAAVNNGPLTHGAGSSISTGATGAAASFGLRAVDATSFTATNGIGPITGDATNSGDVTVSGNTILTGTVGEGTSARGNGSSVSLGSTGAVSSVSTTAINSGDFQATFGIIGQTATNTANVTNNGSTVTTGQVRAEGGSVSVSSAGAVTAVGEALIDNNASTSSTFGAITQNADNSGSVTLDGSNTVIASNTNNVGLAAAGSSVAASATGSAASVSSATIRSFASDMGDFGATDQTVQNTGEVTASDNSITVNHGIGQSAASASITAAGASGSVSSLVLNGVGPSVSMTGGATFAAIDQDIDNTGNVLNQGSTLTVTPNANSPKNYVVSGAGASVGIAAIGASGSVSGAVIATQSATTEGATFAPVMTDVLNSGSVTLDDAVATTTDVSGAGASVSLAAIGAQASASSISVSGRQDMADFGTVGQTVLNSGAIGVTADRTPSLSTGALSGTAASAQIGASGASGTVGATLIASGTAEGNGADIGNVTQGVTNTGAVSIAGVTAFPDVSVGEISGTAASAGISAMGAMASVSSSYIAPSSSGGSVERASGVVIGDVSSTVLNQQAVSVQNAQIATSGPVSGTAASASITATGASSSAGASVIAADNVVGTSASGSTTFGNIDQLARKRNTTGGSVSITDSSIGVTGITGTAASVGVAATGASASVQSSYIGSTGSGSTIGAIFGDITQGAVGAGTRILSGRPITVTDVTVSAGAVDGTAASAGISATGVQANVSVAAISNDGSVSGTTFENVSQAVNNAVNGAVSINDSTVSVDGLGGVASSASIAARGAAASVGVSEIGSLVAMGSSVFGTITQDVINGGSVTAGNTSIISTGGILGTGASASILASGASANFSVTSIDNLSVMAPVQVASINQSVVNSGNVSNSGTIAVGGNIGTASSASISATGATAGVSFTSIAAPIL
jgi:hypothetical protein